MKIKTTLTKDEMDEFLYIINNAEQTLGVNLEDVRDHAKVYDLYKRFIKIVTIDEKHQKGVA